MKLCRDTLVAIAAGLVVLVVPPFLVPYPPFHDLVQVIGLQSYPPRMSFGPTHYYSLPVDLYPAPPDLPAVHGYRHRHAATEPPVLSDSRPRIFRRDGGSAEPFRAQPAVSGGGDPARGAGFYRWHVRHRRSPAVLPRRGVAHALRAADFRVAG